MGSIEQNSSSFHGIRGALSHIVTKLTTSIFFLKTSCRFALKLSESVGKLRCYQRFFFFTLIHSTQLKKFLVEKEWFPSDTQDIQGFTKLPAAPILPVFFLFPSKSELLLPHATTESLSNYPAIHAKPNSPLAFPLMNFIKPQCETRRLHPKARVFRSVGVYQLGKVMWRNYNRRSSDPFLLSWLAARRRSVRNLKLLTHMDLKHSHCYKQLLLVQFFFSCQKST